MRYVVSLIYPFWVYKRNDVAGIQVGGNCMKKLSNNILREILTAIDEYETIAQVLIDKLISETTNLKRQKLT